MSGFDWGDSDDDDDRYFESQQKLFVEHPVVSKILNNLKLRIKNIKDWNRILKSPIDVKYLGYPVNKDTICSIHFQKPMDYTIIIFIQFSSDIKQITAKYDDSVIEMETNDLSVEKIIGFIRECIKKNVAAKSPK
jgi:glycyl-tRNA synthetase beta subunit